MKVVPDVTCGGGGALLRTQEESPQELGWGTVTEELMGEGAPKGPPTQDQQGQRGECTGSGKWGMDMRRRT